jgi:3-phosphoshikimate 1-carboxyvinyltransferase
MRLLARKSALSGTVDIPGSKSHTIRGLFLATLADGTSTLRRPLDSLDTRAAAGACRAVGAEIEVGETWTVRGVAGEPRVPDDVIDVRNSGTTLNVALSVAGLADGYSLFTGDEQIRRRPAGPLLDALAMLGAEAFSTRGNGCPPVVIGGRIDGGTAELDASRSSQFLSSLLVATPFASGDTVIDVTALNEAPYVHITLSWLDAVGVGYERDELRRFEIPGDQRIAAFDRAIAADFSSATFFLCAAAVGGGPITLRGLDMTDPQGDKAVVDMLRTMGASIEERDGELVAAADELRGCELDLNATPDALPALAVTACFAEGETRLVNVPQARVKETDRIAVMTRELRRLGGRVEELEDGLVIQGRPLRGADVSGHGDHRIVMALAVAAMGADGTTCIDTAESAAVTFPDFVDLMQSLGAHLEEEASGESGRA